jgi:hypothetical protein
VFRDSELGNVDELAVEALQLQSTLRAVNQNAEIVVASGVFRNMSLRCRGEANTINRSIMYLGGCPTAIFTGTGTFDMGKIDGYTNAFKAYQKSLLRDAWGFRCRTLPTGVQVAKVTAEAIQPAKLQLNMGAAFPVAPGNWIQLRNFTAKSKAYKPLNGKFQVDAVSLTGGANGLPLITLKGTEGRDPTLVFVCGTAEPIAYKPLNYVAFFALGPSSRKRGVGSGSPVGRKKPEKVYAG